MNNIGRIKVIKEDPDNNMDTLCVCPHCGKHVTYGSLVMLSGIHCCSSCLEKLHKEVESDQAKDYNLYIEKANNHDYEPYRYK